MGNLIEKIFGITTPQFRNALLNRPYTDPQKVIFPWDHSNRDFSYEEYNPLNAPNLPPNKPNEVFNALAQSPYWDPNMDYVTCQLFLLAILALMLLIILPIMIIVMVSGGSSTNWLIYLLIFLFAVLLIALFTYLIYRQQVINEEQRMLRREADFARILNVLNQAEYNQRNTSWETGPRGAYLQYNKSQPSTGEVVIDSPVNDPRLM